jgi:hypothetical protein
MRVSFLERALAGLADYYEQERIDRYLRNPKLLQVDFEIEQEEAEFMRSRGLKPRPSRIPEQFQKGLRGYRPKPKDTRMPP